MKLIGIEPYANGSHRYISVDTVPDKMPRNWAVIPKDMETPNFPFGKITVEEIEGVMTVTSWEAMPVPKTPSVTVSPFEQLRADVDYIAVMTGVDL